GDGAHAAQGQTDSHGIHHNAPGRSPSDADREHEESAPPQRIKSVSAARSIVPTRWGSPASADGGGPRWVFLVGDGCYPSEGRFAAQGMITSNPPAARSTSASANRGPIIWSPTGSPPAVHPQGTDAAGCPVMLIG